MYGIFIVSTERIKYDSKLQPDVSNVAELQLPSIVIFMCCGPATDRKTREGGKCCCIRNIYVIASCEYVSALFYLVGSTCLELCIWYVIIIYVIVNDTQKSTAAAPT